MNHSPRVYAYVRAECCVIRKAVLPGSTAGPDERPVSLHGDYIRWHPGKKETLGIIAAGCAAAANFYRYECAKLVAELRGWKVIKKRITCEVCLENPIVHRRIKYMSVCHECLLFEQRQARRLKRNTYK